MTIEFILLMALLALVSLQLSSVISTLDKIFNELKCRK